MIVLLDNVQILVISKKLVNIASFSRPRYFVVARRYSEDKATPIGNYVSGPLKISFRCGRVEFSNKATRK